MIPANGAKTSQVNIEPGGRVTSHLVKYSHHPDGRAHFSQDGKIFTAIKRQSIALETQHGHIFSLIIQGLSGLDLADPLKDAGQSPKRSYVDFHVGAEDVVKFVGRWYDVKKLRLSSAATNIGPVVPVQVTGGTTQEACLFASPRTHSKHVLMLTCEPIPKLGPDREVFIFFGGFDADEAMLDPMKEAGFLAFLYPVLDAESIRQRVGTVDYKPSLDAE